MFKTQVEPGTAMMLAFDGKNHICLVFGNVENQTENKECLYIIIETDTEI